MKKNLRSKTKDCMNLTILSLIKERIDENEGKFY